MRRQRRDFEEDDGKMFRAVNLDVWWAEKIAAACQIHGHVNRSGCLNNLVLLYNIEMLKETKNAHLTTIV